MKAERKLYKSRNDKVLDGVCGGVAAYFQIDARIVRLAWAVFGVAAFGSGVIAYLIAAFIMPREPEYLP